MVEQSWTECSRRRTRMYVSPHPSTGCMIQISELAFKPNLGTGLCSIPYETRRYTGHTNVTGRRLGLGWPRLHNLERKGGKRVRRELARWKSASANWTRYRLLFCFVTICAPSHHAGCHSTPSARNIFDVTKRLLFFFRVSLGYLPTTYPVCDATTAARSICQFSISQCRKLLQRKWGRKMPSSHQSRYMARLRSTRVTFPTTSRLHLPNRSSISHPLGNSLGR